MQLFSADAGVFKKKPSSKVAHNGPTNFFFSVLPTGPKSAQISYVFCFIKMATCTTSI